MGSKRPAPKREGTMNLKEKVVKPRSWGDGYPCKEEAVGLKRGGE